MAYFISTVILFLNILLLQGQEIHKHEFPGTSIDIQERNSDNQEVSYTKDYSLLPIKSARTISIDTDEGTSMDVDISPDGSKILFTLLGELFVMPAIGGKAIQLTRGLAINLRPAWSPDGRLIAFLSDASGERHVHIRDLQGQYHKVLGRNERGLFHDYFSPSERPLEPIWLPEGDNIVSSWIIYHISGFRRQLSDVLVKLNSTFPSYHETNYNTIIGFTKDRQYVYFEDNEEVKRYDRSNGFVTTIVKNEKNRPEAYIGLENNARVSPDGRWLAYIKMSKDACSSDSLMVYDIFNGGRKSLVSLRTKNPGRIYEQHYSFSFDGKYIYIGFGGKIHCIDILNRKDEIVNFKARVNVDLGPVRHNTFRIPNDSLRAKYTRSANANPDRSKLVFSALGNIYIQNLPNGKPVKLVDQSEGQYHPVFSPDGQWITYVTVGDSEDKGHVWRIPSSGGKPYRISQIKGDYRHPAWSPDGKYIVVVKAEASIGGYPSGDGGQIQIMRVNGGALQIIANKIPVYNQPSFSRDGKRVFFIPKQVGVDDKKPKFVCVELNDSDHKQQVLASGGNLSGYGLQMIISPDERYIAYTYREDLYLAPLIKLGESTLIQDTLFGVDNLQIPSIRIARGAWDPHWENEGKILSWSFANTYYSVQTPKIADACLQTNYERKTKDSQLSFAPTNVIDVPLVADQEIDIFLKYHRQVANGTLALTNARIITMASAKVIERGSVVIQNGRIVQVGDFNKVNIPANAKVLDLKGKTILPGLIDMHVHDGPRSDLFPKLHNAWLTSLAYGVTTVRDPSGRVDFLGFGELTECGKTIGPRIFSVGHKINSDYNRNVTSLEEATYLVDNLARLGALAIKQYTLPSRLQKQWLLMACQNAGVNMTNEGGRLPAEYIAMIKDGSSGVEHIPMFGDVYQDIIAFLAASGTCITPTLQVAWGHPTNEQGKHFFRRLYQLPDKKMKLITDSVFYNQLKSVYTRYYSKKDSISPITCSGFFEVCKMVAAVRKAGGKICLGSHSEDLGIGAHFELWALQMGGLTNYDALEVATIESAKALGLQNDLGSLEAGKIADLVILNKNPLENIYNSTSMEYVVRDGILYSASTLDTLWPFKKALR